MQELVCRVHRALKALWKMKTGRPKSCGLYKAVQIACIYLRQNVTEESIGDMNDISQPTVSRIVTVIVPLVKSVLEEFVPDAREAIEVVKGRVFLVNGTLVPCWSYAEHQELWNKKHKTRRPEQEGGGDGLWVPNIRVTLCDLGVFVDQAAEPVPSQDPDIRSRNGRRLTPSGRALAERPVRAMNVIVLDVLTQDQPQVPLAGDQHLVQALAAGAGNPPLRGRVRPGRPDGRLDDPHADGGEHGVERRGELGVRVPDQELQVISLVLEGHQQVPGCWVTHSPVGWAVIPARCTRRVPCSMTNSTYKRRRNTVST